MGIFPYRSKEETIRRDHEILAQRAFLTNRGYSYPDLANDQFVWPESYLAPDGNSYSREEYAFAIGNYPLVKDKDGVWFGEHVALAKERFVYPYEDQRDFLLSRGFKPYSDFSEEANIQEVNEVLQAYEAEFGFVPRWTRGEGVYSHTTALAVADYIPNWIRRGLKYRGATCACCGKEYVKNSTKQGQAFTLHHLFPRCYFKHRIIDTEKRHKVILLCMRCHNKYEVEAFKLKQELAGKLGLHMDDYKEPPEARAKGLARRILSQNSRTPKEFLFTDEQMAEHLAYIGQVFNLPTVSREDLNQIRDMKLNGLPAEELVSGKIVAQIPLEEWNDFIEMWRKHFITTMKPKFLSKFWPAEEKKEFLAH